MSQVPSENSSTAPTEYLEWVQLNEEIQSMAPVTESTQSKLVRKIKENPFVPLGMLATCGVLGLGLRAMNRGDSRQSQKLMRFRILAQGFTVVALVAGIFIANTSLEKDTVLAFPKEK